MYLHSYLRNVTRVTYSGLCKVFTRTGPTKSFRFRFRKVPFEVQLGKVHVKLRRHDRGKIPRFHCI